MNRRDLLLTLSTGAAALAAAPHLASAAEASGGGGPGPRNLITDVPGLTVGQSEDSKVRTGVTVILPEGRATCAADVRGGGPGTRETALLDPAQTVQGIDSTTTPPAART